jgi:hypothetical protein
MLAGAPASHLRVRDDPLTWRAAPVEIARRQLRTQRITEALPLLPGAGKLVGACNCLELGCRHGTNYVFLST